MNKYMFFFKFTVGGDSGFSPSDSPSLIQNSLLSDFANSVKISALFFLSFLLIFSHRSLALDTKILAAFFPFQRNIFMPVSNINTKRGSRESVEIATGSKCIDGPSGCTL